MFRVDTIPPYRVSRAARKPTQCVRLVPVFRGRYILDAWILWRPRLGLWDAYVADPSMRPIAARMAHAARMRTDNLLDAAAFAASLLVDPHKFYNGTWRNIT